MRSKCSVVNYHTVLLAFALTVSPTASPKSSEKRASSRRPENGKRLTGNVDNPYLIALRQSCPSSAHDPKTNLALPLRKRFRQSPDGEAAKLEEARQQAEGEDRTKARGTRGSENLSR